MDQKLYVVDGPDSGRIIELASASVMTLGRGKSSDTQINDPRISRVHVRVEFRDDDPFLVDAESMGGTYVGNQKIKEHRLRPGDVFQIGDTRIRYSLETADDETTLAAGLRNPPPTKTPRFKDLIGKHLRKYLRAASPEEVEFASDW